MNAGRQECEETFGSLGDILFPEYQAAYCGTLGPTLGQSSETPRATVWGLTHDLSRLPA